MSDERQNNMMSMPDEKQGGTYYRPDGQRSEINGSPVGLNDGMNGNLMASNILRAEQPTSKRNAKASVFTDLFSKTEYLFQLYQCLHPEDTDVKLDDLTLFILESILVNQQFNDLGFLRGNRLLILGEHQSTWTENVLPRFFIYLAETWLKYINTNSLNIYSSRKIWLPKPELYLIYTGTDIKNPPETLSFRKSFFEGDETAAIDLTVKVICDGKRGDIINQYVMFCRIFNEQTAIHGRTLRAVEETIRICTDRNILKEYLTRQKKEILDMMWSLFDQEKATELYVADKIREDREKQAKEIAEAMLRDNEPLDKIARYTNMAKEKIMEISKSLQVASPVS